MRHLLPTERRVRPGSLSLRGVAGLFDSGRARSGPGEGITHEVAGLPASRARRLLLDPDSPDAQCGMVAGTELPVVRVVALVERKLGEPVHDGARAAIRTGLELLGLTVTAPGWGGLFGVREHAGICCADH